MEIIKKYKEYVELIKNELEKTDDFSELKSDCQEILKDMKDFKFLIPVIGNFSAGKSAFLNTFLGKKLLTIDILPETAIATELHYGENERIEAVDKENNCETYSLDELNTFNTEEKEYVYCRLFLNSEKLKSIYPMILVDMPGFASNVNAHNIAIDSYLYFGKHFLVLNSIEDGTVNNNLLKILKTIENRDFTFCLTKTDLLSEKQVNEVNKHIVETIDNHIYREEIIHNITIHNPEYIEKIVENINLEKVFVNIFNPIIKDLEFSIKDSIDIKINAFKKEMKENEKNIHDIEMGIEKIIQKKEELIKESKSKFYEVKVNDIINKIGNEIEDYEDEITDLMLSDDKDSIQNIIVESVNNVLQNNLDDTLNDINLEIANEMMFSLKNIDAEMFSKESIEKIQATVLTGANYLNSKIKDFGSKENFENINRGYKFVTGIASILTNIISPLLEVAIVFLPEIINFFTKEAQEKKQREEARRKVKSSIIPKVKTQIRPELTRLFKEQINKNVEIISSKIEKELDNKKQLLNEVIEESEKNSEIINKKIEIYNEIKENIKGVN